MTLVRIDQSGGSGILDLLICTKPATYGGDTTAFNPSATDVFNNSGATLQRKIYPGPTFTDTDTATDWAASSGAGTPCDVQPTAADGQISGQITTAEGAPLGGVVIILSGEQSRRTITDSKGFYSFGEVETGGYYTVTPELASYSFTPAERAFSLTSIMADAAFTASADSTAKANPLDTTEYFVSQQYLDFLGREPDQDGLLLGK